MAQATQLQQKRTHFYSLAAKKVEIILQTQQTLAENSYLIPAKNLTDGPTELIEYLAFGIGLSFEVPAALNTRASVLAVFSGSGLMPQRVLDLLFQLRLFVLHPVDTPLLDAQQSEELLRFCEAVTKAEQAIARS